MVILHNTGGTGIDFNIGDAIAQLVVHPVESGPKMVEVTKLISEDRGESGFGSTGRDAVAESPIVGLPAPCAPGSAEEGDEGIKVEAVAGGEPATDPVGLDDPEADENPLEGRSPWYKRFSEEFPGMAIPLGCGVFFKPSPTKYTLPKPNPSLAYGIFLGYVSSPGGRWSGQYVVADIHDFAGKGLDADEQWSNFDIRLHFTAVVKLGKRGEHFPLKRKCDWYNFTLEGRNAVHNDN